MRKIFIIIIMSTFVFMIQADYIDIYKQKTNKLEVDSQFGKGTDWHHIFYKKFIEITRTQDGAIFATNNRKNNISKFNSKGELIKIFGKKGEGPGDLLHPGNPTILDNKYLVVDEYASRRRISIFHLDGKFYKIIKTSGSVFGTISLKNGKIAYYTNIYPKKDSKVAYVTRRVIIKDIYSLKEKVVKEIKTIDKGFIKIGRMSIVFGNTSGTLILNCTKEGNLIIGNSISPRIEIFNPKGTQISNFNLKIEPYLVNQKYIQNFKEEQIKEFKKEGKKWEDMVKGIRKANFAPIFSKILPYYEDFIVDSDGNMLFFLYKKVTDKREDHFFDVYSPEGKFLYCTSINTGDYELSIDYRFKNIIFSSDGIYAFTGKLDEDEELNYKIVKFK